MARAELKMQSHIVDSYNKHGGYATKWDAAHMKGKPDLVCAFPLIGAHFIEVKHRPNVRPELVGAIKNPLEPRQVSEARKIWDGGGIAIGGLVVQGATSVQNALLGYFHPLHEVWRLTDARWQPWEGREKFRVPSLITYWRSKHGR